MTDQITSSEQSSLEPRVEESHPTYVLLLHLMVFLYPLIWLAAIYSSTQSLNHHVWLICPLFFLNWLISDGVTGFFHWAFDTYGTPKTPIFGPTIEIFRVHHHLPQDICKSNLVFTIGHVCVWATPLLGLTLLLHIYVWSHIAFAIFTFSFAIITLFTTLTNQFHKWAHLDQTTGLVAWLQKWHIILPKDHHAIHHVAPYKTYYCITNGWLNPLFTQIQLFRRLDKSLEWLKKR